jgi:hypothetical protein
MMGTKMDEAIIGGLVSNEWHLTCPADTEHRALTCAFRGGALEDLNL